MRKYIIWTSSIMLLFVIIVYLGRIYYPLNFQPQTTTFIENMYALILGLSVFVLVFGGCLFANFYFGRLLYIAIKDLFICLKK